ncbi:MAG: hypothetical protein ACYC4U_01785 [Pirellulaceae bacterium]
MTSIIIPIAAYAMVGVTALTRAEPIVTLNPLETWATEFAGKRLQRSYSVEPAQHFEGKLIWSLCAEQRVLARGERSIRATREMPETVQLAFNVDPLRGGVAIPVKLDVAVLVDGKPAATHSTSIWLFAEDPFAGRLEWLRSLEITLFDPVGNTTDTLRTAGVAFVETRNREVVASKRDGLLLVGAGTALSDYRQFARDMLHAAERGVHVICLSPADGSIPLEMAESEPGAELFLKDAREITRLDKRLDAFAWPPQGQLPGVRIALRGMQDRVVAEVGHQGWPWMEIRFPRGGRFLFCGLPIIESWGSFPTPRYLFLRMLESLDQE